MESLSIIQNKKLHIPNILYYRKQLIKPIENKKSYQKKKKNNFVQKLFLFHSKILIK